jgi:CRISPR-associated endonuclease/helicase Cas3
MSVDLNPELRFFAHTATHADGSPAPLDQWEPLAAHLREVSETAGSFAEAFGAREWAALAGLWHDLGKYSTDFQSYLRRVGGPSDPHREDLTNAGGRVDHSTAGAQHSARQGPMGPLLAYVIAGHHSGLPDGVELRDRLHKEIPPWEPFAPEDLKSQKLPSAPPLSKPREPAPPGMLRCAMFVRMVFSSLVDADFLRTEAFMSPAATQLRPQWPDDLLHRMEDALQKHLDQFAPLSSTVDVHRNQIRAHCEAAASLPPGFFDLTVPTGGGKTLSSLLFAIRHARKHGLRRVIYAIPFTSIIEQNADVFRSVFKTLSESIGQEVVLEHHSNLSPARETTRNRASAENWDAPLVVTTNVQLFESLFANRTSASRKIHRIAKSVIILDEAQALPVNLLSPILSTLRCLTLDFGSSVVLCTATQPALLQRDHFSPGIPPNLIRSIIPDRISLAEALRRTTIESLGPLDTEALRAHVLSEEQGALVILNTTKAAREFYEALPIDIARFHLSARMCPEHRTSVLKEIRAILQSRRPVFLVSTPLIEAGVDISFPAVFRAECGLDSLAQSAGRCNRHGELRSSEGKPELGRVFRFQHSGHEIPPQMVDLRDAAANAAQIAALPYSNLLSLEAIEHFFRLHIWSVGARTKQWDQPEVLSCFPADHRLMTLGFRDAASRFRMIDQTTHPLLIPWGDTGKALCEELRNRHKLNIPPTRAHYRAAQRLIVQVYENEWTALRAQVQIETLHDGAFYQLIHPENYYHHQMGLRHMNTTDSPEAFFC